MGITWQTLVVSIRWLKNILKICETKYFKKSKWCCVSHFQATTCEHISVHCNRKNSSLNTCIKSPYSYFTKKYFIHCLQLVSFVTYQLLSGWFLVTNDAFLLMDFFQMIMIKWKEGSTILSHVQVCSQHIWNSLASKDKWGSIFF
jgi:hypothetical protein